MARTRHYYVYIMANESKMTYTGVHQQSRTARLRAQAKLHDGYTKKYNITRLVYMETTNEVTEAIQREKQIKGWLRSRKVALIESENPQWADLAEGWYEDV